MSATKKPTKRNQGRPDRGTKPSAYRLTADTLDHLKAIATRAGTTSKAEAIRIAAKIVAENPTLQSASPPSLLSKNQK